MSNKRLNYSPTPIEKIIQMGTPNHPKISAKALAKILLAVPGATIQATELNNYLQINDAQGNDLVGVDFNQGLIYVNDRHHRAHQLETSIRLAGIGKRKKPEETK